MKNDCLEQWLSCQGYCQMTGAAAAVLSFRNARVVFNGPSWCSLIAERELMTYDRDLQYRLYCSHMEQPDLLFGAGDRVRETLEGLPDKTEETSLLAVLTSCSAGLIGDDVEGIVANMELDYPALALDTGGLTGMFEEGYETAMLAVLGTMDLPKCTAGNPKRVNLIGYCGYYPDSTGDLSELKRLLKESGFEVGVCPGESGLELQELKHLPEAALNIVLAPELGIRTARYLLEKTGQEYMILPYPYGIRQTIDWLEKIGNRLSAEPELSAIKEEAQIMRENIGEQFDSLKRLIPNLFYKQAILALPYTRAGMLADALLNEILEVGKIIYKIQGNYSGEGDLPRGRGGDADGCEWLPADYRLLFGTAADRTMTGEYERTIYLNMYKSDSRIHRKNRTFVGIEGWSCLVQEIIEQTLTLYYLKIERQ